MDGVSYLDTIAVQKISPRTHDDYWSKTRNWILPHVGQHRLDRLQPEHLDAMYAAMFRRKLAASHVLKVHRILSRALTIAVRRGKISHNVAEMIDPPSARSGDQDSLTRDEARKVLAVASRLRNGARWSVGPACGLRQGEALGLRWEFLDLDAGDARSWWQLQRNTRRHGCAGPACSWCSAPPVPEVPAALQAAQGQLSGPVSEGLHPAREQLPAARGRRDGLP